jgi:hypothetical protein
MFVPPDAIFDGFGILRGVDKRLPRVKVKSRGSGRQAALIFRLEFGYTCVPLSEFPLLTSTPCARSTIEPASSICPRQNAGIEMKI